MNLLNFVESSLNIIIFSHLAEMDSNWKLPGLNGHDIRRSGELRRKQPWVVLEVFNSQGSTHDDDAKRVVDELVQP